MEFTKKQGSVPRRLSSRSRDTSGKKGNGLLEEEKKGRVEIQYSKSFISICPGREIIYAADFFHSLNKLFLSLVEKLS